MAIDFANVRVFIPRIRRELDPGVASGSAASSYTDDMLKDIAADAIGELSITVGLSNFPYNLVVLNASAAATTYEFEYETSPEVPIALHSLVAVQAAIQQVFKDLQSFKTTEKISDEGSTWEVQKSSTLFRDQIKSLLDRRAQILGQLAVDNPELVTDTFVNLLGERSFSLDLAVEPHYYGLGTGFDDSGSLR